MGRIEGELDGTAGGPVARVHRKRDAREPRGRLRPCHRRRARVRRRAGDRRVLRRVPNPEHPATPPRRGGLVHGDDPRLLGILRDAVATRGPPDAPRGLGAGARRPRRDGAARHRDGAVARDGDRARHRGGPRAGGARGAPHARDVPVCRLGRARSAGRRRTERTGAVLRQRARPRRPERGDDPRHLAARVAGGSTDPLARDRGPAGRHRPAPGPAAEPSPVRAPGPARISVPPPGPRATAPFAPARGVRARRGAGDGLREHAPRLAASAGVDLVSLLRRSGHGVPPRRLRDRARVGLVARDGPAGGGARDAGRGRHPELLAPPRRVHCAAGHGGRALVASVARTLAASLPLLVWCGLAVLVWPGSRSLLVDVLWLGGTIAGAVGLFWSASVVFDLPERTALLRMLPRAEPRSSPGA